MRNVLKDCDMIAMCGIAMVNVGGDRLAGPRTAVAREAGARSSATETTMARHDRLTTADKPAKFACR